MHAREDPGLIPETPLSWRGSSENDRESQPVSSDLSEPVALELAFFGFGQEPRPELWCQVSRYRDR